MIDQLERVLKEQLVTELRSMGAAHLVAPERIVPTHGQDSGEEPVLSLGLLTVKENVSLRDQSIHTFKRPDGRIASKSRAAVRLDLHYVVTAYGKNSEIERQVLSEALTALFRCQLKVRTAAEPEPLAYGAKILGIEIAQPDQPLGLQEAKIWRGDTAAGRPFFSLVVTMEFNPFEPKEVHLVREAILGLTRFDVQEKHQGRSLSMTTASLAGIVLDQNRIAVPEAIVSLEPGSLEASTTNEGVFVFFNLHPGAYQAVIKAPGFLDHRFKFSAPVPGESGPVEPIVFELAPAESESMVREDQERAGLDGDGRLRLGPTQLTWMTSAIGRIMFESGKPAAYYIVRCGSRSTMTDGQGFWRLELDPEEANDLEVILSPGVSQKLILGSPDAVIATTTS